MTKSLSEELLQVEQLLANNEDIKALELIRDISKREGLTDEEKLSCILLELRIKSKMGERENTLREAEKIWSDIRKAENPLLILDYTNLKISSYIDLGEFDDGIKMFEKHLKLIAELQHKVPEIFKKIFKKKKSELLKSGGIFYWYKGKLDTALKYHEQSLALGEEIHNKNLIVDSYNNIGLVHWSKGDLEKSIEYYNYALRISEELGSKYKIAMIMTNLGNVYSLKGELDKALELLQKGLEIRQELNKSREISLSLINLGVIFQLKGEIDQAMEYYQNALQLSEEIDFKTNIALALNNIGNIYDLRGDLNLAFEHYEKSLEIYKELGVKEKIALLHSNIGSYYRQKDNIKEALWNFNQSLAIYEELGNNLSSAVVLLELIQEALDQNDQETVQKYLNKFHQINKTDNIRPINQRYRLAQALSLKISDQSRDKSKAIVLFEQIIEEEIIDHSITVKALVNLCDMLIQELNQTAEVEVLEEIKDLVQKLHLIAEEQSSDSVLAEIFRLEALLALTELDLKKARMLLQKGLTLAEEKGLENIAANLIEERNNLEEQIKLWEELQERDAPLEETLQYVKIERSAKHLQHEETVTYKKLFSLKI